MKLEWLIIVKQNLPVLKFILYRNYSCEAVKFGKFFWKSALWLPYSAYEAKFTSALFV